jgi:hypothetical protein
MIDFNKPFNTSISSSIDAKIQNVIYNAKCLFKLREFYAQALHIVSSRRPLREARHDVGLILEREHNKIA